MLDAASLTSIEPSIVWVIATSPLVDPSVPTVTSSLTASAASHRVEFYPVSTTTFDIASRSDSGNRFGIRMQTSGGAATDYVKVRVIDERGESGW